MATLTSTLARPGWLIRLEFISAIALFLSGSLMVVNPIFFISLLGLGEVEMPQAFLVVGMLKILFALTLYKVGKNLREIYGLAVIGAVFFILEPFAFVYYSLEGPYVWLYLLLSTYLSYPVWFYYLYWAWYDKQNTEINVAVPSPFESLKILKDENGVSLFDLQEKHPVLLVFLRHSGCTFCRQTLARLSDAKEDLKEANITPILVHMEQDPSAFLELARKHNVDDLRQLPDPNCLLYRSFELGRASFHQAFGLPVWKSFVKAFLKEGHFIGEPSGDGFRMPGSFLLHKSQVLYAERPELVCELPNYSNILDASQVQDSATV